jgi:hypothetical protein
MIEMELTCSECGVGEATQAKSPRRDRGQSKALITASAGLSQALIFEYTGYVFPSPGSVAPL